MKLLLLILIEVVAFVLTVGETYVFFFFVVLFGPFPHSIGEYTFSAVVRMILTVGLGLFWFLVMIGLTRLYVRSKTRTAPRPSS